MTFNLTVEQVLAGVGVLLVLGWVWRAGARRARAAANTAQSGARPVPAAQPADQQPNPGPVLDRQPGPGPGAVVAPTDRHHPAASRLTRSRVVVRVLVARWLRSCSRSLGRLPARVAAVGWAWVGPWLGDAWGWLVFTAPRRVPRWVGRGLWWWCRWALRAVARVLGYAVVGLGWLLVRLVRYVLAYPEYAPLVRELERQGRARRALVARQAWRRSACRRAAATTTVALITGLLVPRIAEHVGAVTVAAGLVSLVTVLAGVGRAVRPRPVEPDPPMVLPPGEPEPFPIADAHTRAEAAQCVARAVAAEAIALRGTGEARRTGWGWEVPVILRRGTPAAVVAKLGELETTLDLPAGGLFAAPDRARRARVVLRLAQRDPFAALAPAPHHPPASLSIHDRHVIGQKINGEDLTLGLLGVHTVVIGTPGAGKSLTLRTLGDLLTACRDALVWDLDPAGTGLTCSATPSPAANATPPASSTRSPTRWPSPRPGPTCWPSWAWVMPGNPTRSTRPW
jgi:hypothetical protein